MKKTTVIPQASQEDRIAELIGILRNAETELQNLTGGGLDAVSADGGKPILLQEAQEHLLASREQFASAFKYAAIGMTLVSTDGRLLTVNAALCGILGFSEAELLTKSFQEITHPDDLKADLENVRQLLAGAINTYQMEKRYLHRTGRIVWAHLSVSLVRDEFGVPVNFISQVQDITERKLADELIRIRAREQEAIVKISFEATKATSLEEIFDFTTRTVADALEVDFCKVLQLTPDGAFLRLVSGVGWKKGLIGVATVEVDVKSQAGYTLKSGGPVYVNDLREETRFEAPPLLVEHEVISGLSVTISLCGKPWGVLGAHSRRIQTFNGPDANFMQSIATLLGVVVERLAVQEVLSDNDRRMKDAQRIAHLGNWELDLCNNQLSWSDEVFRIFGIDPGDFSGKYDTFLKTVFPPDREKMDAAQEFVLSGRGPLELEHRIVRPDGEIRYVRERGELIHDEKGNPVALAGTVLDITEQSRAVEDRDLLFNLSLDLFGIASFDGIFKQVNPAWTRCLGWSKEELTSHKWLDFVHPADQEKTIRAGEEAFQGKPLENFENRYRCRDGSYRWLSWSVFPQIDSREIFTVARDVTVSRKNDEQLRLLELCVSRLNDIVLITDAEPFDEPGPRIVYVNDAFERRTGYSREEVIGKSPRFLQGPKTQRDGLDRIRVALEKWQPVREELINYKKSGEEFWLELDIVPIADETVGFTHWVAIERDITERKNASIALSESEHRLRMALDAARMGTFEWNVIDNFRIWGGAHEAIWGFQSGEYDGSYDAFISRVHPEDRDYLGLKFLNESGPTDLQARVIWPDGSMRWVAVVGEITERIGGAPAKVSGVVTDITERKIASLALAESENRLRLALNAGRMGTFEWDMAHNLRRWSPLHEQLWGFTPGEYDGSYEKFAERVHPEDLSIVNRVLNSCENADQTSNVEFRVVWPDGSVHWMLTLGEFTLFENEKPVGMYGMVMEITERKRIEEEQRKSAESLAEIVKIQQEIASLSIPLVEVMTLMARRSQTLTGASGAVVELLENDEMVYHAASGSMEEKIGTRIKLAGSLAGLSLDTRSVLICDDTEIDPRVNLPSCRKLGIRSMIVAPLRVGEQVIGVLKTMSNQPSQFSARDVNNLQILVETLGVVIERQRALEQIKKSEEQYRLLFSSNPHPMWAYDLETLRFLAVNEAAIQQYGYTEAEFLDMTLRDIRPTEEIPRFERTLGTLSHLGKNSGIWKHRKKDGSIIQVEVSSDGVVFAGRNARLVLAHDVTERERAAEAIASSEREFRNLAESMPQIVWVADPDGSNTYINQNWIDYTGLTIEESLGLRWTESYHPEDRETGWKIWREAMKTGSTYTIESRLRGADGEYRWWLIRGEAQRDAEGHVVKWFGTCTDIHDLKVADLEISRTNRALKMLSSCNEALIHAKDEKTLLEKVCQIAHEVGGYRLAWVGYAMDDAAKSIQPMAFYGSEEGYLSKVNVCWNENEIQGRGPAGRTICSGKPVICEDTLTDPEFAVWRSIAKEHHFRSIVSLPLRDEIRTFGLLVLYSEVVNEASEEEVRLLQEMSDDLAFGISHLRSKLEREKVQNAMLTVASGVSASIGEEFFQQLAVSMCEALGAQAAFVAELVPGEPPRARSVAGVIEGTVMKSFEYELGGIPCSLLQTDDECLVDKDVIRKFPRLGDLLKLDVEAYVGRQLKDSTGKQVGLLFVLFREPLKDTDFITATLKIFAARASSELQRKLADAHVREQAALLDAAHEAIIVKDMEGCITFWNKGAERTYGWTAEEVINRDAGEFLYDDYASFVKARESLLAKGEWGGELVKSHKSGRKLDVEVRWTLVLDEKGNPKSILAINNDVTEKKKLEKQFLRAQRLESIGTLASGIAHDLNNTLAPILMAVEVLGYNMKDPNDLSLLATVEASAQHGAELVQQVLAFGRGVEGQRILVNPVHLLNDIHKMIRDTFPKNIDFRFSPAADLWTVNGDPTQLHQVFTNLCVNARDAMPQGGTISVSMKNWIIDDVYAGMNPESKEGSYVMVQVSDSGTGIPPEIREKIFDPFFTTKEIGKGTGLGLSTVMAIIKSHGGFIDLYSEPGKGTQFKVYIPANTTEQEVEVAEVKQTRLPMGNGEIVLIVDDEERIRFITEKTLRRFGYQTMTAAHGAEAIAIYAERKNEIAVVLTDMAMPVMDGPATIIALLAMNPKVKIIGSSGLQSNDGIAKAIGAGIRYFVPKPYTAETMLKVLAEIIADE